jgi:hypothetical protein
MPIRIGSFVSSLNSFDNAVELLQAEFRRADGLGDHAVNCRSLTFDSADEVITLCSGKFQGLEDAGFSFFQCLVLCGLGCCIRGINRAVLYACVQRLLIGFGNAIVFFEVHDSWVVGW